MRNIKNPPAPEPGGIQTMPYRIPVRMMFACILACVVGIVLMAVTSHMLLMWTFVAVIGCMFITVPLLEAGKISVNTACLVPMLMLCFVYTPLSWFTFDGLLGCTPYLSILFATQIALTYYKKIQATLLSLYALLMAGLTMHWLAARPNVLETEKVLNILVAYILTGTLTVAVVEFVKRKNLEINRQITELSLRDDLTGLYNRRASEPILSGAEETFLRQGTEYAVVMMDIDQFKGINDLYGHHFGDSALKSFAECIRKSIRGADRAFRFGGDEFLLVLPETDIKSARTVCECIEESLGDVRGFAFPITASIGCALRSESPTAEAALELADRRMYGAKRKSGEARPEFSVKPLAAKNETA